VFLGLIAKAKTSSTGLLAVIVSLKSFIVIPTGSQTAHLCMAGRKFRRKLDRCHWEHDLTNFDLNFFVGGVGVKAVGFSGAIFMLDCERAFTLQIPFDCFVALKNLSNKRKE
jgi:hypothetical protein